MRICDFEFIFCNIYIFYVLFDVCSAYNDNFQLPCTQFKYPIFKGKLNFLRLILWIT